MSTKTLTHRTPHNTTYSYVFLEPIASKPWLLFLHGFPETSYDWTNQTTHFAQEGYGIICPDLLGYGGTDKPTDVGSYRLKKMAEEVLSIVDHHGIKQIVGIAHDWGCGLLSTMSSHFQDRFSAFAFLAIGMISSSTFDLDRINNLTEERYGRPSFGYHYFFNEDGAAALFDRNIHSVHSLCFDQTPNHNADNLCAYGGAKRWLEEQRVTPLPGWIAGEPVETRARILKEGGFTGPLNWYKQIIRGCNKEDDKVVPEQWKTIAAPVLYIAAEGDNTVVPIDMTVEGMEPVCKDLRVSRVPAGHWVMWQAPRAVNRALDDFLASLMEE